MKEARHQIDQEKEITKMKLDSLEASLEDARARERSLETVILNLEAELIAKGISINSSPYIPLFNYFELVALPLHM